MVPVVEEMRCWFCFISGWCSSSCSSSFLELSCEVDWMLEDASLEDWLFVFSSMFSR